MCDFCIPNSRVALPARHIPAGHRVPEAGPGYGSALQPVLLLCPASGLGSGLVPVREPQCGLPASACSLGHCSPGLLASNAPAHASCAFASDCMREGVIAPSFFSVRSKDLLHGKPSHAALVKDDTCCLADWCRSDFLKALTTQQIAGMVQQRRCNCCESAVMRLGMHRAHHAAITLSADTAE